MKIEPTLHLQYTEKILYVIVKEHENVTCSRAVFISIKQREILILLLCVRWFIYITHMDFKQLPSSG